MVAKPVQTPHSHGVSIQTISILSPYRHYPIETTGVKHHFKWIYGVKQPNTHAQEKRM